jgi:sulfide:quinone oxidoreductase
VRIDPDAKLLGLASGAKLSYDVLIVASGARLAPDATPGFVEACEAGVAGHFYDLDGALALGGLLDGFSGGKIVVNVAEMPIKCPVAPHEMTFLVEAWLRRRGMRGKSDIVFATPLSGAFTKPVASAALGATMASKGVDVAGDFVLADIDPAARVAHSYDGRELPFDLFIGVPPHRGSEAVAGSGLGDEDGWLQTDRHTLQSRVHPDIWALGDCTDLP